MYFIIYLGMIISVYVATFKDDFTAEHTEKLTTCLIVVIVFMVLLGIFVSVMGGR